MEGRHLSGRYELLERLGDSTWRARDTDLGRDVVVRYGPVVGAGLSHPAIAPVFDQGVEDGTTYAVLEHLPGGTVAERGELGEDAADELAAGLAYAHSLGVVHGAVGAGAILFDAQGRAKLTGFRGEGDAAADLAALESLRAEYGIAATAVRPGVAPAPAPPEGPSSRRRLALLAAAVLLLFAAGLAATLVATGSDEGETRTATFDPISSATVGGTTEEDDEPAPPAPSSTSEETATVTQPTLRDTTTARVPTVPTVPTAPPTLPPDPLPTLPTLPPTTTEEEPPPPTAPEETDDG